MAVAAALPKEQLGSRRTDCRGHRGKPPTFRVDIDGSGTVVGVEGQNLAADPPGRRWSIGFTAAADAERVGIRLTLQMQGIEPSGGRAAAMLL